MKKLLIIFLILLINFVNAEKNQEQVQLSILRDNYNIKETLQAELILNINLVNGITNPNFLLTQDNKIIPIALFLEKLSKNHYFIYFNIPELNPGMYNFQVNDIRYIDEEEQILKQISVKKDFNIANQSLDNSSISVNPGIILRDTKLEITNNLQPINITIEAPSYTNLSRNSLLIDKLILNVEISEKDYNIKINYADKQYTLPVLNLDKVSSITLIPPKNAIVFLNSSLGKEFPRDISLGKNLTIYNPLYIKNTWNFPLTNVTFRIVGDLKEIIELNKDDFEIVKENETIQKTIIINKNKTPLKNNYQGNLIVTSNEDTISYLNLNINFIEPAKITNETTYKPINLTNKTQIRKIPEQKKINFVKLILILLFIVLIIYFIFKKKISKRESFEEHFYKFKK